MNIIKTLFSISFLLLLTQGFAQDAQLKKRTIIEIALEKNGKIEKGKGYLLAFEMPLLGTNYTAVVLDKSLIGSEKKVILSFPMKSGAVTKYEVGDISKFLFTDPFNNLALIRLGEFAATLEHQTIYANAVFVPEDMAADYSFPLEASELKALKESWEQSMVKK
jgi:hypothetical protein